MGRLFRYFMILFFVAMAIWSVSPLSSSPCGPAERADQPPLFGDYQTHCSFTPYSTLIALGLAVAVFVWDLRLRRRPVGGPEEMQMKN